MDFGRDSGSRGAGTSTVTYTHTCNTYTVMFDSGQCPCVMSPASGQSPGLKGMSLVAVLSDLKRFLCKYFFWEGSAPERRQSSRGSRNQNVAGKQ